MARDFDARTDATRRDYLKTGTGLLAAGLVAGCSSDSGDDTTATTTTEGTTGTTTENTTASEFPYTVSMAPMGDVEFEAVPETIFTRLTHLAGMAFALGRGNDVNAMHAPAYYDALWNQFTPRLPGVELDWTGLYSSWNVTKEKLYSLDSDVHLADPASVLALDSWDMADIEEIATNISPWFGNHYSHRHTEPPAAYADSYEYYTLWEQFEKVSQVFRDEAKYEALAEIHADVLDRIETDLPDGDRPSVVMGGFSDPSAPYVYNVDTPGFLTAHIRPLDPVDAFGDDVASGSRVDMEALAEADPDVILVFGGLHPSYSMGDIRAALEDDPVAQTITAVQDGRIYPQGGRYQGPILNLFQLEMTAKQLYPDAYGAWPEYTEGPYPDLPSEEQFFDRQRVADIINGDFEA
ncbi:ABC transporter substrate-binding protein [Salarchaeum japonicum]|uniref:ABC transporter substrate-binding protein n=1 Tax=Salarchaeum japonicum TaxID=555573 RepID=A0AAV3T4C4_9EURY|nr:ABC transporter substrate-binding protein [Salarchaeum japonicum]